MASLKAGLAAGGRWPNVVIRTRAHNEYRPDISGPLCLFVNLYGNARTTLGGRSLATDATSYAVSAAGETFTLEYEQPTEVLNLYFSDTWVADVACGLSAGPNHLDPQDAPPPLVLSRLGVRDGKLTLQLQAVLEATQSPSQSLALQEGLVGVIETLLLHGHSVAAWSQRIRAAQAATRTELARRLNRAVDCMVATPEHMVDLDTLARVACLSKFHFLRSFKQFTGVTPSRFQTRVRVQRAQALLSGRHPPSLTEVAAAVGFSDYSVLSRAFQREVGMRPGTYRQRLGLPAAF